MGVSYSHKLTGIEADRSKLKAAVHRITKAIFDVPLREYQAGDHRKGILAPRPLSEYRALEPLGFGVADEENGWFFHPEDCGPDLVWPLDTGFISDNATGNNTLGLTTFRTISAKEARGYVTKFSPYMVRVDHAQEFDGIIFRAAYVSAWIGGRWVDANGHLKWQFKTGDDVRPMDIGPPEEFSRLSFMTRMASSVALTQRYKWSVALNLENSPSIRFSTDPTGIKELFKVRDLPEGRDRRDALMVWVSDHWRQDRSDPDVEIYVRKHLRGRVQFDWRGLHGEVLPSQYDVERRDRLIAEREAMKAAGKTKRNREAA